MTTITALTRLQGQLMHSLSQLQKAAKQNDELKPYEERARKSWLDIYNDVEVRKLRAAELKDKGQVLFEVFSPKDSHGFAGPRIIRTPHRLMRLCWYHQGKPRVQFRDNADAYFASDFSEAMKVA